MIESEFTVAPSVASLVLGSPVKRLLQTDILAAAVELLHDPEMNSDPKNLMWRSAFKYVACSDPAVTRHQIFV